MKGISASLLTLISVFFTLSINAQISKVKEFEGKPYYKSLFNAELLEDLGKADKNEAKADEYMTAARDFNQQINDFTSMAEKATDVDTRIDALKKMAKVKKKKLKQLEKAYKYYSKGNELRYKTYQAGLRLKPGRLKEGDLDKKQAGFRLEKAANSSYKSAKKEKEKAKSLKGDEKSKVLSNVYNFEILAINNVIDAFKLYENDSTLNTKKDSITTPNVKSVAGFYYTVHVSMFNSQPKPSTFKQITPLLVDTNLNGVLQYNAGIFKNMDEAENAKKEIIKLGFDGAYVVAYEEGMRIPTNEALKLTNKGAVIYAVPQTFMIGNRVVGNATQTTVVQTTVTPIKTTPVTKKDSIPAIFTNTTNNAQTQVKVDLYQSKEAVITSRLKLPLKDQSVLYEASRKEQNADQLLEKVEQMYEDIDLYKKAESVEKDLEKKEFYKDKHVMLQAQVFNYLIKATQLYLDVNENRYKIYKSNLPKIRHASESPAAMRGEEYEEVAEAHYYLAKKIQADGEGLQFKSDKYLKLMEANDRMLLALENQETAFSIYFDLVTTEDLVQIATSDINPQENGTSEDLGKKREFKYIVVDTYIYSKFSPKPKKVAPTKGIVFKIQFGLFKDLPKDNFGNINPITIEKLKGKSYSRFLVGNFKTWEAARHALPIVKNKGYKTAYIVAFKNGKRIQPTAAKHIARRNSKNYEKLISEEISIIKGAKKKVSPTRIGEVLATDLSKTSDLFFTVQLGIFNRELSAKELKNVSNINYERLPKGAIRYTKGMYSNKKKADKERDRLKGIGFKEAFVVAYYKGKRANMSKIAKAQGTVRSISPKEDLSSQSLIFKVQLGAVKNVSQSLEKNLNKIRQTYKVDSFKNLKGLNVITAGDFSSYDAAKEAQSDLGDAGFNDCFVIAFKNNKQIPASLALKLQK